MSRSTGTRTAAAALFAALFASGVLAIGVGAQATGADPTTEVEEVFTFNGGAELFFIPPGVRAIDAVAIGGHGAERNGVAGGGPAQVSGRLDVEGLDDLYVYVGGNGAANVGGFNGGGSSSGLSDAQGGGGGGATDLRGEYGDLGSRLLVAGGGGGAGGHANGGGKAGAAGGNAGADGARAESAGASNTIGSGGFGGKKGGTAAGGAGGEGGFPYGGSGKDGFDGGNGELGSGGYGGPGPDSSPPGYGGGGGGGLYGGGGGGGGGLMTGGTPVATGGGGGGGGSSLVPENGSVEVVGSAVAPSATIAFTIPGTEIDGPTGIVRQDQLSFAIFSEEAETTFECRLDSEEDDAWEECGPTFETPVLAEGPHFLEARATNSMGNFDPTPARAAFTIDLKPPPPPDAGGSATDDPLLPGLVPKVTVGKVKLDPRKGRAKLWVTVNQPGKLTLRGAKLRSVSRSPRGPATIPLPVRAKGKAAKVLRRKGKLRLKVRIDFTATDGRTAGGAKFVNLRYSP